MRGVSVWPWRRQRADRLSTDDAAFENLLSELHRPAEPGSHLLSRIEAIPALYHQVAVRAVTFEPPRWMRLGLPMAAMGSAVAGFALGFVSVPDVTADNVLAGLGALASDPLMETLL